MALCNGDAVVGTPTVSVDSAIADISALEVRIDGGPVGEVPLTSFLAASVVQVGNDSKEQPFELVVDNVKVDR